LTGGLTALDYLAAGGGAGGRLVKPVNPRVLRWFVVGRAVAIGFWAD
jgi:hypothetical protein